jgi:hypothetical protein
MINQTGMAAQPESNSIYSNKYFKAFAPLITAIIWLLLYNIFRLLFKCYKNNGVCKVIII